MGAGHWRHLAAVALFAAITIASLGPIRSYDFFWHLTSGYWIAEHRALPATDPFTVASDPKPWINGEWLFQVLLVPIHALGGFTAIAWARALLVALLFTAVFLAASRAQAPPPAGGEEASSPVPAALVLSALCFAGGHDRLDARPSTAAAFMVAGAVFLAAHPARAARILFLVWTVLWINLHPSALLAPAIAFLGARSIALTLGSAAALLVNPWGWQAIAAPIRLTRFATSGAFVNAEWLPSPPALFPLFYALVVAGVILCILARRERQHWWRFPLFAMFALLAIRHVRNQGLYFAALPLLLTPLVRPRIPRTAAALAAAAALGWVFLTADHNPAVDDRRFPVRAVARLQEADFPGTIYNPDQFGGFLIWSFYPQRRVLTDGRNELYHRYIPEYARARGDSRAWTALLRKYRIDVAVEEYRRDKVEVMDFATRQTRLVAPSQVYFPRREWALIAYDETAMVFVRRAAFPADRIARYEIRGVTPDE